MTALHAGPHISGGYAWPRIGRPIACVRVPPPRDTASEALNRLIEKSFVINFASTSSDSAGATRSRQPR